MQHMVCEMCGGTDLIKQEGVCISNNPGVGWVRADQIEKIVENLKQSKTVDAGDIMPMYKIASEEDIKRMFDK